MSMKDGNFKVRCVNVVFGNEYIVKDGKLMFDDTHYVVNNVIFNSIEQLNNYFDIQFELAEEDEQPTKVQPNQFTIDDIKPCMLVELRDGRLCMVMQISSVNKLCLVNSNGCIAFISDYNKCLSVKDTMRNEYDIIKVYGYTSNIFGTLNFSIEERKLLWERPKEVDVVMLDVSDWKQILSSRYNLQIPVDGKKLVIKDGDKVIYDERKQ